MIEILHQVFGVVWSPTTTPLLRPEDAGVAQGVARTVHAAPPSLERLTVLSASAA